MTSRTAAKRYARALFDVSLKEQLDLENVGASLGAFADLIGQHATLGKALENPAVPTPRKHATVAELLKLVAGTTNVPPVVSKLLLLLADRDRFVLLPEIVDAYSQRLLDHQNVVRAEVTTAQALAPDKAQAIEAALARATGRRVALATTVDPSIIGGVVTRIGGTVYDGSLTGQLDRMKKRLEA